MTLPEPSARKIEGRETSRSSLYLHDGWTLQVRGAHYSACFRIIDMSPFGLGAVLDEAEHQVLLEHGEELSLTLERPGSQTSLEGLVVNKRPIQLQGKTWTRIGILLGRGLSAEEKILQKKRRNTHRYPLSPIVPITCACEDPIFFGQKAFFQVEDVSSGGLCLKTSARNKFPFVNAHLPMQVTVPGAGAFAVTFLVRHIRTTDQGRAYLLGGQLHEPARDFLAALGDFCLAFAPQVTLRELRTAGFPLNLKSQALTLKSSASQSDFLSIVALRLAAYQSQGRLMNVREPKAMMDRFDEFSRQIVGKIGDRIVAATRVVFNDGHRDRSEYQNLHELPEWLWRGGFIEISKICIDPEFRGGAVFLKLGREAFRTAMLEGVSYCVAACLDELWPVYKRLGFRETGLSYHHRDLDEKVRILYGDIERILQGRDIAFLYWCLLGAPLAEEHYPKKKRSVSLSCRLRLARFLQRPLLALLEQRRDRLRSQKKAI